jgi:glutathionylspermidine synthase
MSLREAIETYHELLTDELASASQTQLDDQQYRRGLFFGQRPLCTVLRPRFITPTQYRFLQTRVGILLQAFDKAYQAALTDPDFRAQFSLLDWEEELVQHAPGFRASSPTSRVDTFFVTERGGLRLTEYNAETPASPAYSDLLTEITYGLPVMREFLRTYEVRSLPARHSVLHTLVDAYQQWVGHREAPRIAILDWREVPSYSEFTLFAEYFKTQGLECIITDPREVEYRNGQLVAGDFHITLIYKRVLISELIARGGLAHPVVQAVLDGAVCMVNPFRCKILHKKASLAVLSDERNASLFTPEEQEAIEAHIPWTCRVEERQARYHGHTIDLVPYIFEHREHFVLKPNDEYGGKGIILGWQTDSTAWAQAIQTALTEPYVVQERVAIPSELYPSMVDGHLELIDRMLDTNPFVFYGNYVDGCLSRLSAEALLNVTAGTGSAVATFVVEKR